MRICPQCRTAYPHGGMETCSRDGTRLVDAREFADAEGDPLVGELIAGRYRILQRVGVGGMGTVYRASQAGLERHVALKILKRELNWDRDTVTRFHREARAMSLLTHPNTVRVFDFGETDDGLLFFAMELLEGELLTEKLEREGALEVRDAIRVIQQVLRSLAEAHSKGIIHRDLKPDNIFLAMVEGHPEPVVKVLDFGIAKIVQGERALDQLETQAGTVFGTPRYMSPEQAQGRTLDPRSDLYAVGILLYQLLTGRPPFVDDDAVVVMAKHIRERPDPVREAAPDRPIPVSLERVVLRAVEKDPARRFKTAERFEHKLEGCIPDVDLEELGRRSFPARVRNSLQRAPVLPLAAATLVLGLAFGTAAWVLRSPGTGASGLPEPPRTASAAEPEGSPATASITVDSEPAGAEVWWQGSLLGRTPLTVQRPRGSRMDVELRKEGFQSVRADLVADDGSSKVELPEAPEAAEEEAEQARADATERSRRRIRRLRRRATPMREERSMAAPEPEPSAAPEEPYERW